MYIIKTIESFESMPKSPLKLMILEDLKLISKEINETIEEFHEFFKEN